jgi:hypothetical protein
MNRIDYTLTWITLLWFCALQGLERPQEANGFLRAKQKETPGCMLAGLP